MGLEAVLEGLEHLHDHLVTTLQHMDFERPRRGYHQLPYLKYELVDAIVAYLQKQGDLQNQNFGQTLSSRMNKEELKRVFYGMFALRDAAIPHEILRSLDDWEKICFFAGIWMERDYNPHQSTKDLICQFIKKGYDGLHKMHMIKKAEGAYTRGLKIPGSQHYHQERALFTEPSLDRTLAELFAEEDTLHLAAELNGGEEDSQHDDRLYAISERVGILLDSCSEEQLEQLTRKFGRARLGGYAQPLQQFPFGSSSLVS